MVHGRERVNYYEILEIEPNTPQHDIQKAYLRAKSTYGSDNPALYGMFSREEAHELLRLIEEAYSVLSNPSSRKTYDSDLLRNTTKQQMAPLGSSHSSGEKKDKFQSSDDIDQEFVVKTRSSSYKEGQGKTSLSSYTVDESMEREIREADNFTGALLQRIRTYKNVSLEALSESSRISKSYIIALEKEDFPSLPAPVFVRGFLVQLAKTYNLDPNKVTSSYLAKLKSGAKQ